MTLEVIRYPGARSALLHVAGRAQRDPAEKVGEAHE
jgi:hypothetical protein